MPPTSSLSSIKLSSSRPMWPLLFALFALGHCQSLIYETTENDCDPPLKCTVDTDCPKVKEALQRRVKPNLKQCGWAGRNQKFCCPPETRKSEQACKDLSNEIPNLPVHIARYIWGGEDAEPGEFPHMSALGYLTDNSDSIEWQCGGSLISNRFVLTAAHCIVRQDGISPSIVRLGKTDLAGKSDDFAPEDYQIETIKVHPRYDIRNKFNDIALIRLQRQVAIKNNVLPACLYTKNNDPRDLIVTGWGMVNSTGPVSDVLQKADIRPVDLGACQKAYATGRFPRQIGENQVCASANQKETCKGDSGGPLQYRNLTEGSIFKIVGVTSYGDECGGGRNIPSVYTRVSSYLDWIEEIVWP